MPLCIQAFSNGLTPEMDGISYRLQDGNSGIHC